MHFKNFMAFIPEILRFAVRGGRRRGKMHESRMKLKFVGSKSWVFSIYAWLCWGMQQFHIFFFFFESMKSYKLVVKIGFRLTSCKFEIL